MATGTITGHSELDAVPSRERASSRRGDAIFHALAAGSGAIVVTLIGLVALFLMSAGILLTEIFNTTARYCNRMVLFVVMLSGAVLMVPNAKVTLLAPGVVSSVMVPGAKLPLKFAVRRPLLEAADVMI